MIATINTSSTRLLVRVTLLEKGAHCVAEAMQSLERRERENDDIIGNT